MTKPSAISLHQLRPGQSGKVRTSDLPDADVALLGAMGLCCNATVRMCRAGEPCIVAVMTGGRASCRIGLAKPLAERIQIDLDS
jgi:hypothetical protein